MKMRIILRSWYYFQKGYGTYLAFPIGLFSIATTIYYLGVKNISFLSNLFPSFTHFMIIAPLLYPISVILGWLHFRKTEIFRQEQEIIIASNPYSINKIPPVSIPTWKLFRELAIKLELPEIANDIEEIIMRSQT